MVTSDWVRLTAEPSVRDVRVWVEEKIESLLARPEMWGSPEVLEVLVLEHLDFLMALTIHPAKVGDACTAVRNAWLWWIVDQGYVLIGSSGLVGALGGLTQRSLYKTTVEALRGFCSERPWEKGR